MAYIASVVIEYGTPGESSFRSAGFTIESDSPITRDIIANYVNEVTESSFVGPGYEQLEQALRRGAVTWEVESVFEF